MDNNNNKEEILLDGKEAKPLVLAALGCPYFLIVQDELSKNGRTLIHSHVSTGFNVGYVFDWLTDLRKTTRISVRCCWTLLSTCHGN